MTFDSPAAWSHACLFLMCSCESTSCQAFCFVCTSAHQILLTKLAMRLGASPLITCASSNLATARNPCARILICSVVRLAACQQVDLLSHVPARDKFSKNSVPTRQKPSLQEAAGYGPAGYCMGIHPGGEFPDPPPFFFAHF